MKNLYIRLNKASKLPHWMMLENVPSCQRIVHLHASISWTLCSAGKIFKIIETYHDFLWWLHLSNVTRSEAYKQWDPKWVPSIGFTRGEVKKLQYASRRCRQTFTKWSVMSQCPEASFWENPGILSQNVGFYCWHLRFGQSSLSSCLFGKVENKWWLGNPQWE